MRVRKKHCLIPPSATANVFLDLPENIGSCEVQRFNDLLRKSTDVFALNDDELGCTNVVSHKIDTKDHSPVG